MIGRRLRLTSQIDPETSRSDDGGKLVLNVVTVGLIVAVQFRLLPVINPTAFAGMFVLFLASVGFGWRLGGRSEGDRVAMAFSTRAISASILSSRRQAFPARRRSMWP